MMMMMMIMMIMMMMKGLLALCPLAFAASSPCCYDKGPVVVTSIMAGPSKGLGLGGWISRLDDDDEGLACAPVLLAFASSPCY